jgi:DNA processing protein
VTRCELSFSERVDWLRLARTPGVGSVNFAKLLTRYTTPEAALDALPELARQKRGKAFSIPSRPSIEEELDVIERAGARLLASCEPDFPILLACITAPPPTVIVKGQLDLASKTTSAIVGARNASAAGLRFARELANGLGKAGVTIASGLARGIDGAAHLGSLETGTIAVLAGGIDHIYPPEHQALHEQIAQSGLLVSEMPMGSRPTARDFPRRNRLISGLSVGTLVVEAALKSGSLITARLAGEQGREVMAVPGSPLDPRARGSNQLLRDGAVLIETIEDVLDCLNAARLPDQSSAWSVKDTDDDAGDFLWQSESRPVKPEAPGTLPFKNQVDDPVTRLTSLLSPTPVSLDELARQSTLPIGIVHAAMLEIEFGGGAVILPGGLVQSVG